MTEITFPALLAVFSGIWLVVRIFFWCRQGRIDWKRELQLLWVYLCTVVVLRLTFFPFSRVDGQIQPLVFDPGRMVPPRINLLPFVYLFDYPTVREILLNVIGNSVLFLPYGMVFPIVFRRLDTPGKIIAAGIGTSLGIELLQLPFFDRVSDIDDLILNTVGYLAGYTILHCVRNRRQKSKS